MPNKRKIEVFTAGCALCAETLGAVKKAVASCGCEVIERRCQGPELCAEAKQYRVTSPVDLDAYARARGVVHSRHFLGKSATGTLSVDGQQVAQGTRSYFRCQASVTFLIRSLQPSLTDVNARVFSLGRLNL